MLSFYDFISTEINPLNNNIAIIDSQQIEYTYTQLYYKIQELEEELSALGLTSGNTLILKTDKTFHSTALLLCCIKMGIIYIPVDVNSPEERLEKIIDSSQANAIFNPDHSIRIISSKKQMPDPEAVCVLYTSGSTGVPKGVIISSSGLMAFTDWAIREFRVNADDTLTAYASFHFDLSTFDLFAGLTSGATVWLIDQALGSNFRLLGELIPQIKPTIWYATPTVYSLLIQYGNLSDSYCPRLALFAGEVFPMTSLNALRKKWPSATYYNLYGPTETNVCTFYKLPAEIEDTRTEPYPIGSACPYVNSRISPENELLISGKTVMIGYLNNESETTKRLIIENGIRWYKTGDTVAQKGTQLIYKGRTDRMVKRRGYRIEPGEIENMLIRHPQIDQVAVLSTRKNSETLIIVYYSGTKQSPIQLSTYCSRNLLNYMIPDRFIFTEKIPVNQNGKIDYHQLMTNFNEYE
ncbi:MAG: AMP-binding protein [Flavobacteriales bacterium]|nr:AMP-binding protein [Flavobacteriales bacterium]